MQIQAIKAALTQEQRSALESILALARKSVPGSESGIRYGMRCMTSGQKICPVGLARRGAL